MEITLNIFFPINIVWTPSLVHCEHCWHPEDQDSLCPRNQGYSQTLESLILKQLCSILICFHYVSILSTISPLHVSITMTMTLHHASLPSLLLSVMVPSPLLHHDICVIPLLVMSAVLIISILTANRDSAVCQNPCSLSSCLDQLWDFHSQWSKVMLSVCL